LSLGGRGERGSDESRSEATRQAEESVEPAGNNACAVELEIAAGTTRADSGGGNTVIQSRRSGLVRCGK